MNSRLSSALTALVFFSLGIVFVLLILPLLLIINQAFGQGFISFWQALLSTHMHHAIRLTLLVAAIIVPLNMVFGIFLAWCVTNYRFRGRQLLITLIDIPYATSPVEIGRAHV